jgi:hypothetical protein
MIYTQLLEMVHPKQVHDRFIVPNGIQLWKSVWDRTRRAGEIELQAGTEDMLCDSMPGISL